MRRAPFGAALAAATLLAGLAVSACSGPATATKLTYRAPSYHDWPYFGRDRNATRYAPQTQITTKNLGRLGVAWSTGLGPGQYLVEGFPVEVGRTLYITTSTDEVQAYDAATGRLRWQFTPTVDFSASQGVGGYGVTVNRGVAISGGKVYEVTFDDHLVAISQATGEQLWSSTVTSDATGAYESMAPTVYDGLVYVGVSGSDYGVRGFIAAYNANTGRQVWRFYTVPAPGTGWVPKNGGGGAIYMPPTVDTSNGLVYAGTGNPAPTLVGVHRPGLDLYSDSILALRARTGKLVWYHQEVAHDLWNYDAESPVMIVNTRIHGRTVHAVAEAGKSGYFFLMNAATGKDLFPRLAFVREDHRPPTTKGTLECPGPVGGSQYSPLAFDPQTQAAYVSGINLCFILTVNPKVKGGENFGGTREIPAKEKPTGVFAAVNLTTGRFLWRRTMPTPMIGGATTTASNLVMTGDQHGTFYIMNAKTGHTLWTADLGLAFGSAPIVYSIGRTEYIAVAVGGSATTLGSHLGKVGARLVVFRLGGVPVARAALGA
ncbi:MAG TPA: PQQ-binding-like beta-propeller repeat protein [Verrucomicrobiae bacterium]|nr:PQQ-binding-like beta-propeller repeat protein [Verrucomicrobiae bacterium]